jgi:hypothetical protein
VWAFERFGLLFRKKNHHAITTAAAAKATPPTTPPTIAGVVLDEPGGSGDCGADGEDGGVLLELLVKIAPNAGLSHDEG